MTDVQAIDLWTRRVFKKAKSIDPKNEHDWGDLACGFFLGLGMGAHRAKALVCKINELDLV